MRSMLQNRVVGFLVGALTVGALLVVGCAQGDVASEPVVEVAPPSPAKLPTSLNEVMVALVNHAADPIWVAAWKNPETDRQWNELERLAYQLELAGSLLTMPGTGPLDEQWVADPSWKKWADDLRDSGTNALSAVKSRDLEAVRLAGDEIVETCEGCHTDFKPAQPTGGQYGELSPTEADLEGDEGNER